MSTNLKHFLIGGIIGLVPVLIYAQMKIGFASYPQIKFEAKTDNYIAIAKIEKGYVEEISTPTPMSTVTISPIPTNIPVPSKAAENTVIPSTTPSPAPATATPTQTQAVSVPADMNSIIDSYATVYGVSGDMMKLIAKCESGYRSSAVNGPYAGMYQFISSTWVSNRKAMGLDPDPSLRFNAEESIKTAAYKMSRDGYGAWPACSRKAFSTLNLASSDI